MVIFVKKEGIKPTPAKFAFIVIFIDLILCIFFFVDPLNYFGVYVSLFTFFFSETYFRNKIKPIFQYQFSSAFLTSFTCNFLFCFMFGYLTETALKISFLPQWSVKCSKIVSALLMILVLALNLSELGLLSTYYIQSPAILPLQIVEIVIFAICMCTSFGLSIFLSVKICKLSKVESGNMEEKKSEYKRLVMWITTLGVCQVLFIVNNAVSIPRSAQENPSLIVALTVILFFTQPLAVFSILMLLKPKSRDKSPSSGKSLRERNNSTKKNTADEVSVKEFESISMKDLVSKSEGKPEDN